MEIKYGDEYKEEEIDEDLGTMPMPPLVGVKEHKGTSDVHPILVQLEEDIKTVASKNKREAVIDKTIINHFKEVQLKAKKVQDSLAEDRK